MELIQDYAKAVGNIRNELENYILKSGLKSLVVGISGGIDSALTAALASTVCRKLNIQLIGRFLTIESNKPEERKRGEMIGKAFCTDYQTIDLTEAYLKLRPLVVENIVNENFSEHNFKIRMGNIKARIRMIYLYELAAKNRGMVLSTDNYTELLLGFWTLHGDVGDYGMIQQMWKTEVYQMSKFLVENECNTTQAEALQACVDALPTDGLGITNSDLDQLKANSYAEVDKILIQYLETKDSKLMEHPVIQRHIGTAYKRNNPLNLKREIYFK